MTPTAETAAQNAEARVRQRVQAIAEDLVSVADRITARATRDYTDLRDPGFQNLTALASDVTNDVAWAVANLQLGYLARDAGTAERLAAKERADQ